MIKKERFVPDLIVNGELQNLDVKTVAELVEQLGFSGSFATAVNETFVPQSQRSQTPLSDGDRVEVLAPMEGG